MSKIGGINKMMNRLNRNQQKRDWVMILKAINKELPEPDWSKSVKKIDDHMEQICKENDLNSRDFFGIG